MKHLRLLLIIACFIAPLANATDEDRNSDREALKKILVDIQVSLNDMDMDALMQSMDEDISISFMTTEVAVGREQIEAYYDKMFLVKDAPLRKHTTVASIDAPALFRGNTAIAYGMAKDTFILQNGEIYNFDTRWSATAVKNLEDWKVVAINFSVNPFDNILLETIRKHLWLYTLLAFLAGIIVTALVTKLRNSK